MRSRGDLRRVHRAMGTVSILRRAIEKWRLDPPPRSIVELGAGDGTLLLRLAHALQPPWRGVELTLIDRHDLLSPVTREAYRRLDWRVTVRCGDAIVWAREPSAAPYDLCVAALFLHHFQAADLAVLLAGVARRSSAFVACEPRRDLLGRLGSACIGLLGANAVTREDAVTSVAAGFAGDELTTVWPRTPDPWILEEYRALPFTQCFSAVRGHRRLTANQRAAPP